MGRLAVFAAWLALALGLLLSGDVLLQADSDSDPARRLLSTLFRFGTGEFSSLDRRQTVTRTLETADGREVATLGVVRMGVPSDFYVGQLRDIVGFKGQSPAVLQIGVFSTPARQEDVMALTLDERDRVALRRCRVGDCKIQLSAEAIERVRHEVPWGRPEAATVADRTYRQVLVDLVNRYRASGDAGLMTYVDADRPVSLSGEFRAMVASPPAVLRHFPGLARHLDVFPSGPAAAEDIVYWAKEKMGPTTIVTVTHLALTRLESHRGMAAASKQLYGSHYFDASLGITAVFDDPGGRGPESLLVYVNRSRVDVLRGFWGGLKGSIVRSRARSAMGDSLIDARDLVERRFGALAGQTR